MLFSTTNIKLLFLVKKISHFLTVLVYKLENFFSILISFNQFFCFFWTKNCEIFENFFLHFGLFLTFLNDKMNFLLNFKSAKVSKPLFSTPTSTPSQQKIHFIVEKCPKEAKMASPLEPKNYQFFVQKRQKNVKII